jgi:hypothetical protein
MCETASLFRELNDVRNPKSAANNGSKIELESKIILI